MQSDQVLHVLFIGDIVGRSGRKAVSILIPKLKSEKRIDFVIANCENAAGGFGMTKKIAEELSSYGINVMTSGNHIWDRREIVGDLDSITNLIRPLNYPSGLPGRGWVTCETQTGVKIVVVNLIGRVFMRPLDCPFRAIDEFLSTHGGAITIVDMHAEATSEKLAMGWYLDGRVSAVIGTHTHVQTADERILPKGTAYITDVGMTGPFDSVIGITKESIIERFIKGIPTRFDAATGDTRLSGVLFSIDVTSKLAKSIERIHIPLEDGDSQNGCHSA